MPYSRILLIVILLIPTLSSCQDTAYRTKQASSDDTLTGFTYVGEFRISFYWIVLEENFSGTPDTPIYTRDGRLIDKFPYRFVKELEREGTGKLRDGRIINTDGKGTYKLTLAPYGIGVSGQSLRPFKSVAVDKELIRIGTQLYIPYTDGIKLPDGTVHQGFFYADDVGSAIRGNHIDIFVGIENNTKVFERAGIAHNKWVKVYRKDE